MLVELRESVGDDPAFLAELVGDFLADAPAQLESLRGRRSLGRRLRCEAGGAHAEGQQPHVRGQRARLALPGGRDSGRERAISTTCCARLDEIEAEWRRVSAALVAWRDG